VDDINLPEWVPICQEFQRPVRDLSPQTSCESQQGTSLCHSQPGRVKDSSLLSTNNGGPEDKPFQPPKSTRSTKAGWKREGFNNSKVDILEGYGKTS
jgi:hypothetical protein